MIALPQLRHELTLDVDGPVLAIQVIRRVVVPDRQHLVDGFQEHLVAVGVEVAECLGVRQQATRADAEQEAAVEHMVEHGDLRGDRCRMRVRHVDGAGAELHGLGLVHQAGEEDRAGGDVLGAVGDVFAAQSLDETQFVGEHEGFAVLAQRLPPILGEWVDWHGEEAELHLVVSRIVVRAERQPAVAVSRHAGMHARQGASICSAKQYILPRGIMLSKGEMQRILMSDVLLWQRCAMVATPLPARPAASADGHGQRNRAWRIRR